MLRYAAMTLLSKTLQTFLYKYLVDIDVEGVAMPSLMDAEGSSGWGVKLSNVRLREGVELMALPGKRRVRKRTERQDQKHVDEEESAPGENETHDAKLNGHTPVMNGGPVVEESTQRKPSDGDDIIPVDSKPTTNGTDGSPARPRFDSSRFSIASECSSGPPTPKAESSWTCFKGSSAGPVTVDRNQQESGIQTPVFPTVSSDEQQLRAGHEDAIAKKLDFDGTHKTHKSVEDRIPPPLTSDEGGDGDEPIDAEEEQDKESNQHLDDFSFEQDMILRLGVGGRIGTLNVRLVGKELYVLVEDAFLVVEAVPKEDVENTNRATKDDSPAGQAERSDEDAPTSESKKTPNDKEPQTVADKVTKSSGIARALSAIPRLLLRDCRIRLVVRSDKLGEEEAANAETTSEINSDDTVVEVGVELLSVTNGEDFLAHFGSVDEDPSSTNAATVGEGLAATYGLSAPANVEDETTSDRNDKNQYLMKRIRTGKGPEGGIWLKIFPPGRKNRHDLTHMFESSPKNEPTKSPWALHTWYASQQMCLFRCSGLDLRARIYLGKKDELTEADQDYAVFGGNEYDEYTIDSMLFGVDYVVPGPSKPRAVASVDNDGEQDSKSISEGRTETVEDQNGIQRFQMKSMFHRVGRGSKPNPCQGDHLPCEHCLLCWEQEGDSSPSEHPLDNATPMPGVIMHLSLNDPLEINIDRPALEVLGVISTLLTKKSSSSSRTATEESTEETEDVREDDSKITSPGQPASDRGVAKIDHTEDAFPPYMQPETIQLMGVQIAQLTVRIHVMTSSDGQCSSDCGLSFCYWDTLVRCITLDHQKLSVPPPGRSFQDMRLDLGELTMTEYKGTESRQLISLGLPVPECKETPPVSSQTTQPAVQTCNRSPWPSTASALLNVPVPHETLVYESRERHAVQLRYISVSTPETADTQSLLDARIGTGMIDKVWETKTDIYTIIAETKKCLRGGVEETPKTETETSSKRPPTKKSTSLLKYKIRTDGGSVNPYPSVHIRVPLTIFTGQKSSDAGFFLQSLLHKVEMQYGQRPVPSVDQKGLSLPQLASLPESVRMRILLCLSDLDPLEKALGVKRESNSFLRCRAVNKKMVKLAKKSIKSKRSFQKKQSKGVNVKKERRQELLSHIMKMDDADLESLMHTHHKMKRRAQKAAASSKKQPSTQ